MKTNKSKIKSEISLSIQFDEKLNFSQMKMENLYRGKGVNKGKNNRIQYNYNYKTI